MGKQQWAYTVVEVVFDGKSISVRDAERDGSFEELGAGGWELVAVQAINGTPLAFFKRQEPIRMGASVFIGKRDDGELDTTPTIG